MSLFSLVKAPWYRGQLLELDTTGQRTALLGDLNCPDRAIERFLNDAAKVMGFTSGFYKHQCQAFEAWSNSQDVLMALDAGSGRSTVIQLVALANVATRGRNSLLLLPDDRSLELFSSDLHGCIESLRLKAVVQMQTCAGKQDIHKAAANATGLVLCTLQDLSVFLQEGKFDKRISLWLRCLGVVGFQGLTLCSTHELAHLRSILRVLRAIAKDGTLMLSALPMASSGIFAASLCGQVMDNAAVTIEEDTSAQAAHQAGLWFPALHAKPEKLPKEPDLYTVARANYLDEATMVTAGLAASKVDAPSMIAVWHPFGSIGSTAELGFSAEITRSLQSTAATSKANLPKLYFFESPEHCPTEAVRRLDVLVVLGLTSSVQAVREQSAKLLCENGVLIIIVPDDPITFAQLREPRFSDHLPSRQAMHVPVSDFLDDVYFNAFLHALPGQEIERRVFSTLAFSDIRIAALVNDGRLQEVQPDLWKAGQPKEMSTVSILQTTSSATTFTSPQGDQLSVDTGDIPFVVFTGVNVLNAKTMYQLNLDDCSATPRTGKVPVATIPQLSIEMDVGKTIRAKVIRYGDRDLSLSLAEVDIQAKQTGYVPIEDFSPPILPLVVGISSRESFKLQSHSVILDCECPKEMAVLLWQYLRLMYARLDKMATVMPCQDGVAVVAHGLRYAPTLSDLYERVDMFLPRFVRFAYQLLDCCPCINGCTKCLCHLLSPFSMELDKSRVMGYLAELLQHSGFGEDLQFKSSGLDKAAAQPRYQREMQRVIRLFSDRFNLTIGTAVPIEAVSRAEIAKISKQAIGLFIGGPPGQERVLVVDQMPEARVVEVISHEYAHNWEHDPAGPKIHPDVCRKDLPFEGKLLVEGFAQWVAFKVCDHLSLLDEARSIRLWVDDEYGEGFDLLNWVEEELVGYLGVLRLINSGRVTLLDGSEMSVDTLYQRFKAARRAELIH